MSCIEDAMTHTAPATVHIVGAHKTNVNSSAKNLNNRIKSNNESSSVHNRLKIARQVRWKDMRSQVNPR